MDDMAAALAGDYITAVSERDFGRLDEMIGDDVVAVTGGRTFDKSEWLRALRGLVTVLERNEIRHVFADGADACVVYDFVTDTEAGAVPCVELVRVENGRLTRVELIFERLNWHHVTQAMKERAAA